jgi:hypothetical protein
MTTVSAANQSINTIHTTTGSTWGGAGGAGTYITTPSNIGQVLVYGGGGGGGGGAGTYQSTGGTWAPMHTMTLQTAKNRMDVDELIETVQMLKERLLILSPMLEKHEKYPALKQAYDHYKMIEKMIAED